MNTKQDNIIRTDYAEIMQKSYIDYAMSVIISRALPDVRDGLKPVQRRTLYDMYELGIRYDRPYRKCARIVGDTMGKYHPHGDSSIYDALVVMAQEFKKGRTLVDGHGNFGSIEGDGAAAMRYTEARLEKLTQEVFLEDLDKNVVDFMPNFDETEKEPVVLPVRIPNLLVNGADGIAVGMATSIPPHNLGEVVDAVKAYMKNNDISTRGLMRYLKGPDFPTGGIVVNKDELKQLVEEIEAADLDENDYDADAWKAFAEALKEAKDVLASEDATQADVYAAYNKLAEAVDNMIPDTELPFVDVAEGDWYTDAVIWANKKGIITGYTDTGLFGPGDDITREQLVVMMYRYQKSISDVKAESVDLSDFKDGAKVSAFAKEAMEWAVGTGVISGKDNGTVLDPQGTATRAECATIIIRMLDNME